MNNRHLLIIASLLSIKTVSASQKQYPICAGAQLVKAIPHSSLISFVGSEWFSLIDSTTGIQENSTNRSHNTSLAGTPENHLHTSSNYILFSNRDRITLWDMKKEKVLKRSFEIEKYKENVQSIVLNPLDGSFYTSYEHQKGVSPSIIKRNLLNTIPQIEKVVYKGVWNPLLAINPAKNILCVHDRSNTLFFHHLDNPQEPFKQISIPDHPCQSTIFQYSKDGSYIIVSSRYHVLFIIDPEKPSTDNYHCREIKENKIYDCVTTFENAPIMVLVESIIGPKIVINNKSTMFYKKISYWDLKNNRLIYEDPEMVEDSLKDISLSGDETALLLVCPEYYMQRSIPEAVKNYRCD
jgi:hypothetical protein